MELHTSLSRLKKNETNPKELRMSVSECMKDAFEYKKRGNIFYVEQDWHKALAQYSKIILCLKHLQVAPEFESYQATKLTTEENASITLIRCQGHTNAGMCLYKQKKITSALDEFNKALALNPKHIKAIFQRGRCYLTQGDIDKALIDLNEALGHFPQDSVIKRSIKQLHVQIREDDNKEKQYWKQSLNKLKRSSLCEATGHRKK